MMRSMYSGVSGLRAHQSKMDVIGNNIANVNTVGFKAGRVTFQEVFNQTLRAASAPDQGGGRGGVNPMQVGLGIGISAVDTVMTRGSLQRTDNPTDLSIEGDGFFILRGGTADTYHFTRAGNFGVDKLGNLVATNGMNVYGWQAYSRNPDGSYVYDVEKPIEPINLYSDIPNKNKMMIPAKATTSAVFAGNLDATKPVVASTAAPQFTIPMTVYDSLGNDYKVNINFVKTAASGAGAGGAGGNSTWFWSVDTGTGGPTTAAASNYVQFDTKGQIIDNPGTSDIAPTIQLIPAASLGSEPINVKLDFQKLTMYAADSSAKPTNIDGYPTGNLITFNVGGDGIITGIYSNGQQQPLGLLALAGFENPGGLQKAGDNTFIPTTNSGDFKKGLKPGSEGVGTLSPGTLEMANVDLSKEFTDMIVTQRGFQANSRIITTSDEMLQELVNLKR